VPVEQGSGLYIATGKKPGIVGWTTSSGRSATEFNHRYGALGNAPTTIRLDIYPVKKDWMEEWVQKAVDREW
jgi:hypothetical protein